LLYAVGI